MFDAVVSDLSDRYGLGDRSRELFGLLVGYIFNDRRGGFGGFVEGFRQQGHGELVTSWIGNPASERGLNANDVGTVFGQGLLNDWSGRLGTSRATLAAAIAGVLPRLVAELTPGRRMPGENATQQTAPATPAAPATPVAAPVKSFDSLRNVDPRNEPRMEMPSRAEAMASAASAATPHSPIIDYRFRKSSPRRRGGMRWIVAVVALALIGGGAYYAWWQGLLDPYLKQLNLQ